MKKIIALCLLLTGCASFQELSSGQIGCVPSEIKVSDIDRGFGSKSWVAECKNKRFICTENAAGYSTQTACREELKP